MLAFPGSVCQAHINLNCSIAVEAGSPFDRLPEPRRAGHTSVSLLSHVHLRHHLQNQNFRCWTPVCTRLRLNPNSAATVVLTPSLFFAARSSWMQLQRHPHAHLSDPYGTFRRPEWALLDAATASRASPDNPAQPNGQLSDNTAASAPSPARKHPLHLARNSADAGASAHGGIVASTRPMHERQAEAMQGLLALLDCVETDRGRVGVGAGHRPPSNPGAVFRRRVWISSATASTLSLRTVLVRLPALRQFGGRWQSCAHAALCCS